VTRERKSATEQLTRDAGGVTSGVVVFRAYFVGVFSKLQLTRFSPEFVEIIRGPGVTPGVSFGPRVISKENSRGDGESGDRGVNTTRELTAMQVGETL
jgi:hypothetical protein